MHTATTSNAIWTLTGGVDIANPDRTALLLLLTFDLADAQVENIFRNARWKTARLENGVRGCAGNCDNRDSDCSRCGTYLDQTNGDDYGEDCRDERDHLGGLDVVEII